MSGNLATFFPAVGGNLQFAVDLTGTGWQEVGNDAYVGAYQPDDPPYQDWPRAGAMGGLSAPTN